MDTTKYFCNLTALSSEQRNRYQSIANQLHSLVNSITEQPNGYDLTFQMNQENFMLFAEFVIYEGLCCPFLSFNLSVQSEQENSILSITGAEGVKPFIQAELGLA